MKPPTTEPLLNQWGRQARAACRGMDSAVFFSPCGEQGEARRMRGRRARSVCHDCPVRSEPSGELSQSRLGGNGAL
ncbi:WhiB family transcriptional regulator [Kitasatospora sp. CB02891]|uniref:WhiB family transcriptional regulator n=1 Tax=Kitasatospora sp. CB02891 TaxID=2020329 RepID=UPI000C270F76|nr:hypothetical protein CG736_05045 [Kitasatospora sp. CB02891]